MSKIKSLPLITDRRDSSVSSLLHLQPIVYLMILLPRKFFLISLPGQSPLDLSSNVPCLRRPTLTSRQDHVPHLELSWVPYPLQHSFQFVMIHSSVIIWFRSRLTVLWEDRGFSDLFIAKPWHLEKHLSSNPYSTSVAHLSKLAIHVFLYRCPDHAIFISFFH